VAHSRSVLELWQASDICKWTKVMRSVERAPLQGCVVLVCLTWWKYVGNKVVLRRRELLIDHVQSEVRGEVMTRHPGRE